MYSIQFSDWGLVLEFTGRITEDLITDWLFDIQQLKGGFREGFGVVIDLREAHPDSPIVSAKILRGLQTLDRAGMKRAAVVISDDLGAPWALPPVMSDVPGMRRVRSSPGNTSLSSAHGWVRRSVPPRSGGSAKAAP